MASEAQEAVEQERPPPPPKLLIYPTSQGEISPFWKEKYERDAKKYWDIFYKRHEDRFFKDRHYLDKEWGLYFSAAKRTVILEVGCGVGNTIFPLISTYEDVFIHACDFSPRAVDLVKTHKDFKETQVNAFVCDLTVDDLKQHISPSSVDVVTMIFVLSAVSPEKMPLVLQNIKKVLKPNGYVLFRDYATGDLAQERFTCKDQKISENFYVRGDGTRAFYFSGEFLTNLFKENGFDTKEYGLCCKQVENRSRELVMNRRWVQAVFRLDGAKCLSSPKAGIEEDEICDVSGKLDAKEFSSTPPANGFEIDMSEGMAFEMFGVSSYNEEIVKVNIRDHSFEIKVLSKEYQHTCKSTGLMLWESARLMASVLAANHNIVAGKRVLELGCGCGGICSMVAAEAASADLVVATDGDPKALDLLNQNIASNLKSPSTLTKLITKRLDWGNTANIEDIKLLNDGGFEVIIGTDVTYVSEAISPLFATARELISCNKTSVDQEPALILCHVLRRVDEPSILSAASQYGFRLVDSWPERKGSSQGGIIKTWFSDDNFEEYFPTKALNIMYFNTI